MELEIGEESEMQLENSPPLIICIETEFSRNISLVSFYSRAVEAYASVISGLAGLYTDDAEGLRLYFYQGLLGFCRIDKTRGVSIDTLLWSALRKARSLHSVELSDAATRRAVALANLSQYVASDVIAEGTISNESVESVLMPTGNTLEFIGKRGSHTEFAIFNCPALSESLKMAESVARMGCCWAGLLVFDHEIHGGDLIVLGLSGLIEGGATTEGAGLPYLTASESVAVFEQARLLLACDGKNFHRVAEPMQKDCVEPKGVLSCSLGSWNLPHLELLAWGPAVLCVGRLPDKRASLLDIWTPSSDFGSAGVDASADSRCVADVACLLATMLTSAIAGK